MLLAAGAAHAQTGQGPPPADTGEPIQLSEIAARAADVRACSRTWTRRSPPARTSRRSWTRCPPCPRSSGSGSSKRAPAWRRVRHSRCWSSSASTWDGTRAKLRAWNEALTQWTSRVEQERSRLAGLRESWARSREAAASAGAPKVVLDQIDGILGGINAARTRVETRLSAPLVAQYRLAQLQRRADEAVTRVAQARTDRLRRLGERDGPPLWGRGMWAGAMSQAAAAAHDVRAAGQAVIAEVAQQHGTRVPLHALLFLILVTLLWRGRRAARRWTKDDPSTGSVIGVFNRPISSALVLACFVAPWIYTTPGRSCSVSSRWWRSCRSAVSSGRRWTARWPRPSTCSGRSSWSMRFDPSSCAARCSST